VPGLYAIPIGDGSDPDAYDFFTTRGARSPGVCEFSGGSRSYIWDLKQGAGSQGATETYRGWKVTEGIKFKIKMWKGEQITYCYNTFLPLLRYDATKQNPQPIDIQHPVLMANDIFSVITIDIGPLTNAGAQLWTVEVEFSEYRPPPKKNATATPNNTATNTPRRGSRGGLPSSVLGDAPTAQQAQDAEIQRLLTEFNKPT
jgi:hypothetical protein